MAEAKPALILIPTTKVIWKYWCTMAVWTMAVANMARAMAAPLTTGSGSPSYNVSYVLTQAMSTLSSCGCTY